MFKLLINGQMEAGATTAGVVNPATEEVFAEVPIASKAQLDKAVAAAKAAFPPWSAKSIDERRAVIRAMADVLEANAGEIGRLMTQEQGKPLDAGIGEARRAAIYFRNVTTMDLPVHIHEDSANRRVEQRRRPLGVIGAIVPWNFPIHLMATKVPAALLTGNTVVLKPAPTTPLSTLRFCELVKDIVPPGVLNCIADAGDLGVEMTCHPDIAKISFTGSTATGKRVMEVASKDLKRVTLELGGNDAAIVLDDVDPKSVAPKLFNAAFRNTGQICVALKRLYVHDSIYEPIVYELHELAKTAVVGDGMEQGVQFGPLQNKAQFERVKELLADAAKHGTVLSSGVAPTPGYFIRPTIVRDISDGARLVDEEQFGPVLPVIRYTDPQDALSRANASIYGLGGSIWSSDLERAYALAERMESGTVWINKHPEMSFDVPFAGAKQSGLGVEMGEEGLAEFTQIQVINIARG